MYYFAASSSPPVIYHSGKFYNTNFPENLKYTWDYNPFFHELYPSSEYARLYVSGKNIAQVCPEKLIPEWKEVYQRYSCHLRSIANARISSSVNKFDLIPKDTTKALYSVSCKILENIFAHSEKPKDYDTLKSLSKIVKQIQIKDVNIDREFLLSHKPQNNLEISFIKKMMSGDNLEIRYDIFGTITGRMTTDNRGLSILTMPKSLRPALLPKNDVIVEIDYNAAELRVALSLLEIPQPMEDIHDWNMRNVFSNIKDRSDAKVKIFSWLYNSSSQNAEIEKIYDRKEILSKYYSDNKVRNIFEREILCEQKVALNYIIQSTAADMFSRQLIKVSNAIKDMKTEIMYVMHDSIVLDFSRDDLPHLKEILKIFSSTDLGNFAVNVSIGENYRNMRTEKWKM